MQCTTLVNTKTAIIFSLFRLLIQLTAVFSRLFIKKINDGW